MLCSKKNAPFMAAYDNSIDAFIPEQWANESIAILIENMVAANLVHRDFEDEFQKFGDTVNTRKPHEFTATRKGVNDDVTVQAAEADNVAVVLDQHVHVSFLIRDGEETKSFKDLVSTYLRPAALAMARAVDQIVLGQVYQFLQNSGGTLGGLTTSNGPQYITDTRKVMNINKVPMDGRQLILTSNAESKLLQNAIFIQANTVGDQGGAMAEATLGRKFGYDIWLDQNMSSVPADSTVVTDLLINLTAGYPVGATVLVVDGHTGDLFGANGGKWISIGGIPYHVIASTLTAGDTTGITLEYGLREAVANNAVITTYDSAAVNLVAGYAAGYSKAIVIDGVAGGALSVGQLVTIGTGASTAGKKRYTVIQTNGTTSMVLDRPLEVAAANDDTVNFGPTGDYNFAFHRNAVSLVIRPLALPKAGTGALSGLASFNNVSMRTVITYNGTQQGHLVTLDFLAGIKVLDTLLGAVMLT